MNKPKHRYLLYLNEFDTIVKKTIENHNDNQLSSFGQLLYQNDGRTPFFKLQGLARIDLKCGKNAKKALKWKEDFKSIEDAIGIYDFWSTLLKNNQKWNFPKEASSYIEYRTNLSLGVLEERLITKGWITKDDKKYLLNQNNQLIYENDLQNLIKSIIQNKKKINNINTIWIVSNSESSINKFYLITEIINF